MGNQKNWLTSWGAIILAFMFFWPIGFVLLYLRFFNNGGKLKMKTNTFWGIAILCYFLVFCMLIVLPDSTGSDFISSLIALTIFLTGAIILTVLARKTSKELKYYKKYTDYILAKRDVTVNELVRKMGRNAETVISDMSKIFEYEMLKGYISEDNEIILAYEEGGVNPSNYTMPPKKQIVTVKCKNCGATNKFVIGRENRCEYCDSLLNNN